MIPSLSHPGGESLLDALRERQSWLLFVHEWQKWPETPIIHRYWSDWNVSVLSNSVVNHQRHFVRFFGVIFTVIVHVIILLLGFIFVFFVDFCTVFARRILNSIRQLFRFVRVILLCRTRPDHAIRGC